MTPQPRAIALILFLACAAGCGRGSGSTSDAPKQPLPTVQAAPARVGPIDVTLPATATIAAPRDHEATVSAPVSGVLDGVFVKLSDHVAANQAVAHLSTHALEGQIQQAQATLAQNRVQVTQANANAVQQTAQSRSAILQAEAAVAAAEANRASAQATLDGDEAAVHNAQQALDREQSLLTAGIVAGKDVEAAQLTLNTAVSARNAQMQAVRAASAMVESQRQGVESAQAATLQNLVKQQDIIVAKEQMRSAAGALGTDQAQLALYTLRAPLSGTVTAVGSSPGETVDTTTKIITVTDLTLLQLQAAVPLERQRDVHAGQQVTFSAGGRFFASTIQRVGNQVDSASNTVTVLALVPNPSLAIKDDTIVQASIHLARHTSAIIIPKAALLESPTGVTTVMIIGDDNKVHERKVVVGLRNPQEVEIVSGVAPGERVATVGAYGLPDGTEVTVAPDSGQGAP